MLAIINHVGVNHLTYLSLAHSHLQNKKLFIISQGSRQEKMKNAAHYKVKNEFLTWLY